MTMSLPSSVIVPIDSSAHANNPEGATYRGAHKVANLCEDGS